MKKITNAVCLSLIGAAMIGCQDKDKSSESEQEEIHGINLAYMDTTTSPKSDFFRYVNGTWLDETEIPGDQTTWGSFNELRENTDNDALALLNEASNNPNLDASSDQAKAVNLYKTIMDTVARNEQGVKPVLPYLEKVDEISSKEDLQAYLTEASKSGGGGFFSFGVRADAKNSSQNAAYLYPGSLGLPDRDYYVADDSDSKEKKAKYEEHIARMMQFLDYSEDDAKEFAKTVVEFETKLAEPRLDKVERRDARKTYNPMTVAELQEMVNI